MSSYHRRFFFVILVIIFLLIAAFSINAQEGRIYHQPCPYSDGTYYQGDVFPRYEYRNQQLVLVSWDTGEVVQEIETELSAPEVRIWNWSPDCRYLVGWVGTASRSSGGANRWDTVIWDIPANVRIHTFSGQIGYGAAVTWSPMSDRAVVQTGNGVTLWFPENGTELYMFDAVSFGDARPFYENIFTWDLNRRQLIAQAKSQDIVVFNMDTAEIIAYLQNPARWGHVGYFLSNDRSQLVMANVRRDRYLAVWNRANYVQTRLNTEGFVGGSMRQIALSPDNRYLVVGYTALRVWDLQNLAEELLDRTPAYIHEIPNCRWVAGHVTFVSPTVVEVTCDGLLYQRIDVVTGELLPSD